MCKIKKRQQVKRRRHRHVVEVARGKGGRNHVQRFALPGQTAAWHSSTIYARVNGYVGK